MQPLERWIEAEYRHAGEAMLASISAIDILKTRPGFGQSIRPRPGSVVASAVLAAYDPDPDYFFHWYRDSAIVMDALRVLYEDGTLGPQALQRFAEFVHFSRSLATLDGRTLVESPAWRSRVQADFARFLRSDADLASVHGAAVAADTRVNADGTLDISSWARPQHDGPASRVLTVLRWARAARGKLDSGTDALLSADLEYVRRHAREPCFDIWEEEQGLHYYTLRVSAAALAQGADWLERTGAAETARECRLQSAALEQMLDGFWLGAEGYYRSRVLAAGRRTPKELDIAVVLAVIHACEDRDGARTTLAHGVSDPRVLATLDRLDEHFVAEYPINHERPAGRGPALGRYPGDVYYSGGAYYFSTLAAAELCYRASCTAGSTCELFRRGDAYLETVRAFTPASGDLSEQFDRRTGAQTSAKQLAWSYAALISCVSARRAARARATRKG
jgi:glucoamylase